MTSTSVQELRNSIDFLPIDRARNNVFMPSPSNYPINGLGLRHGKSSSVNLSKKLIGDALFEHISQIDLATCEPGEEDSFFVADLGEVYRLFNVWKSHLPRIHPYYAVKCNTDTNVIKLLAGLGANFDCASKGEIDTVLALGVSPERIIYANPCKANSFLRHAAKNNVNYTTFDNAGELYKIKKNHPNCNVLLRIATDDETAQCRLSTKYGAVVSSAPSLLQLAKEIGVNIVGVSFHIGSGANDFTSLAKAIRDSRFVFDEATKLGFKMEVVDVGGGFSLESFSESAKVLNDSLDKYFPEGESENIKLIAEPGRFFVATAFTLATHVIARRDSDEFQSQPMVYINDGVYGNMNCIIYDHQNPEPFVLTHNDQFHYGHDSEAKVPMSIWGPTCDGLDCITKNAYLSHSVSVGDWLYFPNLGAYTSAASTPFNGFKSTAQIKYISSEDISHLNIDY